MIFMQIAHKLMKIDDKPERDDHKDEKESGETMAPNVDALVMNHEHTLQNAFWSVEIDSVTIGNHVVVLHELRSHLIAADKVLPLFININL
jgi:hypothetical protein